jgi:hypothetical protein
MYLIKIKEDIQRQNNLSEGEMQICASEQKSKISKRLQVIIVGQKTFKSTNKTCE